jgi:hypothetical protein
LKTFARKKRKREHSTHYGEESEESEEEQSILHAPRQGAGTKWPALADLERELQVQIEIERELEEQGALEKELRRPLHGVDEPLLERKWNEEQGRFQSLPELVRVFESSCADEKSLDAVRDYDEYQYAPEPYRQAMDQSDDQKQVCHTLALIWAMGLTPTTVFYPLCSACEPSVADRYGDSYFWYNPEHGLGGCRLGGRAKRRGTLCGAFGKYNHTFVWYDPKTGEGELQRAPGDQNLVCNVRAVGDNPYGRIVCAEAAETEMPKAKKTKLVKQVRFATEPQPRLRRTPSLVGSPEER